MINILNPENNGWTLEDDKYHFHWFDGDQLPDFVSRCRCRKAEENTDEQDDDLDIQYQDWLDDELPDFNDDDMMK
ncbi:hypothetical protein EVAR_82739_1 [Eumeta japonica]|uniref:Uncharacterized protein n=1 Tax=Eumeta variegata TaxID=151549 RepID=A0A4C1ZKH6_EUMVA|nr:hypothetical protein EVAR_82739_1 [Eumeta japonica]